MAVVSETPEHHWDAVYRNRAVTEVSWFQSEPAMSMQLLADSRPPPTSVIDVGAGASVLVDALLATGHTDLTALDVSDEALSLMRQRLAERHPPVSFIVADVLEWTPHRHWDAWHDRAVFHFLVDRRDQARYVATAEQAVSPGGIIVLGTFAPDGPEQCSGLPTARYDADDLAATFQHEFRLERAERELHRTPSGAEQAFTWVVLRRSSHDRSGEPPGRR